MCHRFSQLLLASAVLFLGACRTPAPTKSEALRSTYTDPVPVRIEGLEPEPEPGVSVSPPQTGDTGVAFTQSRQGERTFPHNRIGANLAFTSNLRMPKLEAVALDRDTFQLRMRFSNASDEPLYVSLACIYEGETRAARTIRRVRFPVNTYRDIAVDLEGDVSRKIQIQATATPAKSLVSPAAH